MCSKNFCVQAKGGGHRPVAPPLNTPLVCVCVSQEGMEWMCCYTDVFVCVSQEGMEWMCCYTDVFVRVCVSGDVLLHRCVCVCVSQEGMEWMCTNIKKKK